MHTPLDTRHTDQRVLVRSRHNLERLGRRIVSLQHARQRTPFSHRVQHRTHEPTPPATLNSRRRRIKLLLELLHGPKIALQGPFQGSVHELTPILVHGGQVGPKQRMIDVS